MYRIAAAVLGVILIAALTFGGWQWYDNGRLRTQVESLAADVNSLTIANQAKQATIDQMIEWQEQNQRLVDQLNLALQDAEVPVQQLQSILSRHNLERLAFERPGLIERRINDATRNAFDSIQCSTGDCSVQPE